MAHRVCPLWIGYLLSSPLRRLWQNPEKMLEPYIEKGMTALDIGCAMGFFSLPLAEMTGEEGRVICIDLQSKMLDSLEKRAEKAGLEDRIETRVCNEKTLGLEGLEQQVDFALAMAVVHEVPDAFSFLSDVYIVMKPGGKFMVSEPKGHVSAEDFELTVAAAEEIGFFVSRQEMRTCHTAILEKNEEIP